LLFALLAGPALLVACSGEGRWWPGGGNMGEEGSQVLMVLASLQALMDFKICLDPWTQCLQAAIFAACGSSWAGLPPRSAFIFLATQKIVMYTCFNEQLRGRCFSPAEGVFWAQASAMMCTAFYEGWMEGFVGWHLQDIMSIFLIAIGIAFLLLTAAAHLVLRQVAIVSHQWSPICSGLLTLALALAWALTGIGGWAARSPEQTPMSWAVQLILRPQHAQLLLLQWPLILLVGVGSIHFVAGRCDASACGDAAKLKVLYRKAFHMLAIALFVPPILTCQVAFLGLSLLIAAILFVVVEVCRAYKVPGFATNLDKFVSRYLDKREDTSRGDLVLTHLYLLLGCAMPVWLEHRHGRQCGWPPGSCSWESETLVPQRTASTSAGPDGLCRTGPWRARCRFLPVFSSQLGHCGRRHHSKRRWDAWPTMRLLVATRWPRSRAQSFSACFWRCTQTASTTWSCRCTSALC